MPNVPHGPSYGPGTFGTGMAQGPGSPPRKIAISIVTNDKLFNLIGPQNGYPKVKHAWLMLAQPPLVYWMTVEKVVRAGH